MPVARSSDHPGFELPPETGGVTITSYAAPARGAKETLLYRADLPPGARLPEHRHDHEEVFHVASGTATSVQDGARIAVGGGDAVMIPSGVLHHLEAGDAGAVLLVAMPVGTKMIRPDGTVSVPPWGR